MHSSQLYNLFRRKVLNRGNMCGIVGYVGNEHAASILLEGLKKLEYRGYDSQESL
jgi:hypothetical protein